MRKKKKIKKIISLLLCAVMLFTTIGVNSYAAENSEQTNSVTQYKIYNGYGEIIYIAESLEEAEAYIYGTNEDISARSARSPWLFFKTLLKIGSTIGLIGATYYTVNGVTANEKTALDLLDIFFPFSTLKEMAENRNTIYVYSSSGMVTNPYPPNSYQGSQWYKTNFYCVVAE